MKKLTSISLALLAALVSTATVAQINVPLPTGVTPKPGSTPPLPPGLYVQVIDGLISVTNKSGAQSFSAGQFGYTASPSQPPVVVPKNPALQFTPPPSFTSSTKVAATTTAAKSGAVDCEVR
ncbi:hypothetical protein SAMN05216350_106106 [Polaromonas sp. YR568]|uniref:hypothetical protein n=1 Tax=Polaromonas sp. YR568 TaxID=1855301 RepID=UPI0008E801E9|nr:hypothetical protein [Polaromonas sp. YR568]SFU84198.1 hypothetical protein SAMN05216350_106106 [Polaromonas sp. YR568]